ncbi:hypothetical protein SY212_19760 [Ligilactobacillus agilis]|uniref:Uncharacterized protein n=1 Tax=Ligilactobacillus agilis TaxID=1601 RepID=A0A6F9XNW4_9LACO|nr:hypothetical protein [Ligilactobacillus agilis]GET06946.1 hypothetical protein SY212_19760 [Ligilactobacillus agilis]
MFIKYQGYIKNGKIIYDEPFGYTGRIFTLTKKEINVLHEIVSKSMQSMQEKLNEYLSQKKITSVQYMHITKALIDKTFYTFEIEPEYYYIHLRKNDFEGYVSIMNNGLEHYVGFNTKEEQFGIQTKFNIEEVTSLAKLDAFKNIDIKKYLEKADD